jgi:hypothetical protein
MDGSFPLQIVGIIISWTFIVSYTRPPETLFTTRVRKLEATRDISGTLAGMLIEKSFRQLTVFTSF